MRTRRADRSEGSAAGSRSEPMGITVYLRHGPVVTGSAFAAVARPVWFGLAKAGARARPSCAVGLVVALPTPP